MCKSSGYYPVYIYVQWTLVYPNILGPTPVHISEMLINVKYHLHDMKL